MKTYKEFITEVSADTDIVHISHMRDYIKAHDDLRDASSAAGRIRSKDPRSQQRKKELRRQAETHKEKAKRHLDVLKRIRKQYKERGG